MLRAIIILSKLLWSPKFIHFYTVVKMELEILYVACEIFWLLVEIIYSGKHRLLAEEACVSAEISDWFSMMILRTIPYLQCLGWMTFSRTYGNKLSCPMQHSRMAAVARAFIDDQLLIERSTTYRYIAYLLDSQQNTIQISGSYDILVVDDACSTAWVPYSARESIPVGAVVAGKGELSRTHYIVGP